MNPSSDDRRVVIGCATMAVVALLAVIFTFASGAIVSPGYVGVISQWGQIDVHQQPLQQGFHPVVPFVTHIDSISVQPQNHTFREVAAASQELQNVYVDGGVNYHIAANQAAEIQIEGGLDAIVAKVFDPAFQDYMKEVVPQYGTLDILKSRSTIRDQVKAALEKKARKYGITVDDVFITNIHFDATYTKAIESAATAQQQLQQAKTEAQTTVTRAQAQADANRIQAASLSPELINYYEIQKWDGKTPQVVGSGSTLIGVNTQKGPTP